MSIEFELDPKAFMEALSRVEERLDHATAGAVAEVGRVVQTDVAAEFGKGRAPHSRSGRLARATEVEDARRLGFGDYSARVGPAGLAYVRVTELGKRGRRHRKAHPFFGPGFMAASHRAADVYRTAWTRALSGGG